MNNHIIVATFSEEIQKKYASIGKQLRESFPDAKVPPLGLHLSVTPPFNNVDQRLIKSICQKWHCNLQGQMLVSLCGVNYFTHGNETIFYYCIDAPLATHQKLSELRNDVMRLQPNLPDDFYRFHLHATLLIFKNLNENSIKRNQHLIRKLTDILDLRNIPITAVNIMQKQEGHWESSQRLIMA